MHQIKSVDVLSVAKILGVTYGCLALIFVPVALLAGMASLISGQKEGAIGGAVFLVFAIIAPVIYGAMGFLMGALMAWVYNLVAKRLGGIKLELQPVQVAATPSSSVV